jgi:hypothetical protein
MNVFSVFGQNNDGEWLVMRPDGLMCSGTWKTEQGAQRSCIAWNGRKSSWDTFYA